jgi:hypothetical protein
MKTNKRLNREIHWLTVLYIQRKLISKYCRCLFYKKPFYVYNTYHCQLFIIACLFEEMKRTFIRSIKKAIREKRHYENKTKL